MFILKTGLATYLADDISELPVADASNGTVFEVDEIVMEVDGTAAREMISKLRESTLSTYIFWSN